MSKYKLQEDTHHLIYQCSLLWACGIFFIQHHSFFNGKGLQDTHLSGPCTIPEPLTIASATLRVPLQSMAPNAKEHCVKPPFRVQGVEMGLVSPLPLVSVWSIGNGEWHS